MCRRLHNVVAFPNVTEFTEPNSGNLKILFSRGSICPQKVKYKNVKVLGKKNWRAHRRGRFLDEESNQFQKDF